MVRLGGTLTRRLLDALLGATARWARAEPFDEAVATRVRHGLILDQHLRYVEGIPAYRRLAEERGLDGPAGLEAIAGRLVFAAELFKSYDPGWLERGDFTAMTGWLHDVSTCRPAPPGPGVRDLAGWQAAMRGQGVHLSLSSATSGRPSIVPRDGETWAALCGNGRFYATTPRGGGPDADFLALMPRGTRLGLQAAAEGLARGAARHDFLDDPLAAAAFLARSAREGRPALAFGPPGPARDLCDAVIAGGAPLRLAGGSRLVTGGGWKGGPAIGRDALRALAGRALGLPGAAVTDAYSATELNAVLSSCPHGRYHVPPLIEAIVLDDALEWVRDDDAEGLLAFLDPFARSYVGFLMPGDRARLTREPCPCGLAGPSVVGEIERAATAAPRGCAGALSAA